MAGQHEQVFEVEPRLREEGREIGEEQREGDHRAVDFGDQRLGHRTRAEQVRTELFRRDLQQVGQLLEFGKAADQADDRIDVARLRRAQPMRRAVVRIVCGAHAQDCRAGGPPPSRRAGRSG